MTATARFLHQLCHDFRASRPVLVVLWALLALSIPGLWLQWRTRDIWTEEYTFFRETDLVSGWAALFATFCLAALTVKISPHDTEGFYHSRPNRSGVLLLSVTSLFLTCVLLPVMIQQAFLSWMAVGSVPWTDTLLRLLVGMLPYAMCFTFAFVVGTTIRQRAVLLLITLIVLYYTRFSGLFNTADDIFVVLPWNLRRYLDEPFSVGYLHWPSSLPHPYLRTAHELALFAIALGACAAAWRWRWRLVPLVVFFIGIFMSHRYFIHRADNTLNWLSAEQEKTDALGPANVTTSGIHVLSTGPPEGGFELKLLPVLRDVPPPYTARVGLFNSALIAPGHWEIRSLGEGFIYSPNGETNLDRHLRLAPAFSAALFGNPVVYLGPMDRDNSGNPERDRDPRPENVAVFMHEDADSLDPGKRHPETARWLEPVRVESDIAMLVSQCRIVARLPLRVGARSQQGGHDLRVAQITPTFKTIRTVSGAGSQWSGCGVDFWDSSLVFDHHDDRQRIDHTLDKGWIPLLYNPVRHEMLGDMKTLGKGRTYAGTPVLMGRLNEHFSLAEDRIGTVDEHWLDDAELVLLESTFVGTLKRHLVLENLQPVKDAGAR